MTPQIELAKQLLTTEKHALVLVKEEQSRVFDESGIRPLLRLIQQGDTILHGAYAADKVVGKAAAMLFVLGGICEIYANVISETALQFLNDAGVPCTYDQKVPYIINRDQTGMCPMERCCLPLTQPQQAYLQLSQALERLSSKKPAVD